jgi:hypothetical protein
VVSLSSQPLFDHGVNYCSCLIYQVFLDNDFFFTPEIFCVKKHGLGTYTVSLALFFVLLLFKTFLPPLEDILFLKPWSLALFILDG